ncbi:MAG: hypothetical protein R2912_01280 [Eubacteriales bacterium]
MRSFPLATNRFQLKTTGDHRPDRERLDVEDGKPKVVEITNNTDATVTNLGNGSVLVSADAIIAATSRLAIPY